MQPPAWTARLAHWLGQTLLPRSCPGCGQPWLERAALCCARCATRLAGLVGRPYCPSCAAEASPLLLRDGRCPRCSSLSQPHKALARVGPYRDILGQLINRYKYHRAQNLDRLLAELLYASLQAADWFDRIDLIVPVPTHWSRRLARGYDHTALLARQLAERASRRFVPALRAARPLRHQVGLNFQQRQQNVRGAFAAKSWIRHCRSGICLLDDVTTTGATLREAGRTLRLAGAEQLYAAVLAKAELSPSSPLQP
ncbi:MAG: ComF family protein [Phycisphaerae bacterium]